MKAKLFALITCMVLAGITTTRAGTCTSAAFNTYFAGGFSCTVGDVEFSDFSNFFDTVTPTPGGPTPITPLSINVTPSGSDATTLNLTFTFNTLSVNSNQTSTVSFDYTVTPLPGFALSRGDEFYYGYLYSGTGTTSVNEFYSGILAFPDTAPLLQHDSIEASGGTGGVSGIHLEDSWYVAATPVPAALPLFATGLGALGLLGWRRKRKAIAVV